MAEGSEQFGSGSIPQSVLTGAQTVLMPESEQHVPHSEIYFKTSEFIHLIDFLFDLTSRSTRLTSISTMSTSTPAITAMTHEEK